MAVGLIGLLTLAPLYFVLAPSRVPAVPGTITTFILMLLLLVSLFFVVRASAPVPVGYNWPTSLDADTLLTAVKELFHWIV